MSTSDKKSASSTTASAAARAGASGADTRSKKSEAKSTAPDATKTRAKRDAVRKETRKTSEGQETAALRRKGLSLARADQYANQRRRGPKWAIGVTLTLAVGYIGTAAVYSMQYLTSDASATVAGPEPTGGDLLQTADGTPIRVVEVPGTLSAETREAVYLAERARRGEGGAPPSASQPPAEEAPGQMVSGDGDWQPDTSETAPVAVTADPDDVPEEWTEADTSQWSAPQDLAPATPPEAAAEQGLGWPGGTATQGTEWAPSQLAWANPEDRIGMSWTAEDAAQQWSPDADEMSDSETWSAEEQAAQSDDWSADGAEEWSATPTEEWSAEEAESSDQALTASVQQAIDSARTGPDCVSRVASMADGLVLNFGIGSVTPEGDALARVREMAEAAASCPEAIVTVEGHSDSTGGNMLNMELSWTRAENTIGWFAERGIDTEGFRPLGFGTRDPAVEGTTDAAQTANRRVEFSVARRAVAQN